MKSGFQMTSKGKKEMMNEEKNAKPRAAAIGDLPSEVLGTIISYSWEIWRVAHGVSMSWRELAQKIGPPPMSKEMQEMYQRLLFRSRLRADFESQWTEGARDAN